MMMIENLKKKNLLHLQDVYKSYGEKLVLDDIDFSVAKGELCTVVGPSGCGKSTMLRLILGQENCSTGQIFINGQPVQKPNRNRGIVYQRYSLFPHLTVLENVLLGKRLELGRWRFRQEKTAILKEAQEFLARARLQGHESKFPHELSGGMQQRVAIIQALMMKPMILLMDEPFGALDPSTRLEMQLFLLELWEETQMTIFFVTHDLEEAIYLGTRIIVLSQYYSDDRKNDVGLKRGAKIVCDYNLKRVAKSPEVKEDPEFVKLMKEVRQEGFDPKYLQHIKDFSLKHPDSFRTLAKGEIET